MRHIVDPRQTRLFDPYERVFSPLAYRRIHEGWQGVFRHVILETMPVDIIGGEFSEGTGRPTKELYSVAGLVFIKEFNDWTNEQAADAYMFDLGVQYALNLDPRGQHSLSSRTLERYLAIFREQGIAAMVFDQVTAALVAALEQNVRTQRLDSTHVFSNMAVFGRTRLMGVAVKRFLTQVRRHDTPVYEALPEEMRKRYKPAANRLFGDMTGESRKMLRSQIAGDMLELIRRFEGTAHENRSTFMDMVRVFNEQCTMEEEKVLLKEKPGSRVMSNPSDPDATYDGFKGQGYQVQVAETCGDDDIRLITAAIPQTAADSDMDSLAPLRDVLAGAGLTPERLLADGGYGSDANVQACAEDGVELVSPVNKSRRNPEKLHVDNFDINPETECVLRCPAGHAPIESIHDASSGKTRTVFDGARCSVCPLLEKCPAKGRRSRRTFHHTSVQRRNAARFRHEMTDAFRTVYAKRAGIEGTFSRIKSCTGMRRLRVRGSSAVFMAIILKLAGWNILQAAKSKNMRRIIAAIIGDFLLKFRKNRVYAILFNPNAHLLS